MKVKPRLRHMPHSASWEWYMYVDVKIEGTSKVVRINGFGWTPEGALKDLYDGIDYRNEYLNRLGLRIDIILPRLIKIPKHCIATSNLPWWKRLLRI